MKIKHKKQNLLKKLFSEYSFRIIYDDPKIYDIRKCYIPKKMFKKGIKNGIITIYFFKHKKIVIKIEEEK